MFVGKQYTYNNSYSFLCEAYFQDCQGQGMYINCSLTTGTNFTRVWSILPGLPGVRDVYTQFTNNKYLFFLV